MKKTSGKGLTETKLVPGKSMDEIDGAGFQSGDDRVARRAGGSPGRRAGARAGRNMADG